MLIKIVSTESELRTSAKGTSYSVLIVTYKNPQGKIENKQLMPFGAGKRTVDILKESVNGQSYEITTVKNESGYWDWTDAVLTSGEASAASSNRAQAAPAAKSSGSWETPEERAKKQVYIVRQSSLSAAVATLTAGVKSPPDPNDVIKVAKLYESFVFDTEVDKLDNTKIDLPEDDIDF